MECFIICGSLKKKPSIKRAILGQIEKTDQPISTFNFLVKPQSCGLSSSASIQNEHGSLCFRSAKEIKIGEHPLPNLCPRMEARVVQIFQQLPQGMA